MLDKPSSPTFKADPTIPPSFPPMACPGVRGTSSSNNFLALGVTLGRTLLATPVADPPNAPPIAAPGKRSTTFPSLVPAPYSAPCVAAALIGFALIALVTGLIAFAAVCAPAKPPLAASVVPPDKMAGSNAPPISAPDEPILLLAMPQSEPTED